MSENDKDPQGDKKLPKSSGSMWGTEAKKSHPADFLDDLDNEFDLSKITGIPSKKSGETSGVSKKEASKIQELVPAPMDSEVRINQNENQAHVKVDDLDVDFSWEEEDATEKDDFGFGLEDVPPVPKQAAPKKAKPVNKPKSKEVKKVDADLVLTEKSVVQTQPEPKFKPEEKLEKPEAPKDPAPTKEDNFWDPLEEWSWDDTTNQPVNEDSSSTSKKQSEPDSRREKSRNKNSERSENRHRDKESRDKDSRFEKRPHRQDTREVRGIKEKTHSDKPHAERSLDEKTHRSRSQGESSSVEKPKHERNRGEKLHHDKSHGEKSHVEKSHVEKSHREKNYSEKAQSYSEKTHLAKSQVEKSHKDRDSRHKSKQAFSKTPDLDEDNDDFDAPSSREKTVSQFTPTSKTLNLDDLLDDWDSSGTPVDKTISKSKSEKFADDDIVDDFDDDFEEEDDSPSSRRYKAKPARKQKDTRKASRFVDDDEDFNDDFEVSEFEDESLDFEEDDIPVSRETSRRDSGGRKKPSRNSSNPREREPRSRDEKESAPKPVKKDDKYNNIPTWEEAISIVLEANAHLMTAAPSRNYSDRSRGHGHAGGDKSSAGRKRGRRNPNFRKKK